MAPSGATPGWASRVKVVHEFLQRADEFRVLQLVELLLCEDQRPPDDIGRAAGNELKHPALPVQERARHPTLGADPRVMVYAGGFEVDTRPARRTGKGGATFLAGGVPRGDSAVHWMKLSHRNLGNIWRYMFCAVGEIESQSTTRDGIVV